MAAQTPKKISQTNSDDQVAIVYLVETTALDDGHDAAIAKVKDLPSLDGYKRESTEAEYVNRNPLWFQVTDTWTFKPESFPQDDDPLERPSILSSTYEEWTEPYFVDEDDPAKPVVNSAGDPFDPLPQRKNGSLVLQITKNFAAFDAAGYDAIKFTTNAVAQTIRGTVYPIGSLLFLPPTVQEIYEIVNLTEHHYYQTTFRLAVDSALHVDPVEDRGLNESTTDSYRNAPILDAAGNPVTQPAPLDGAGQAKARGEEPEIITFYPYASANWGIDWT